MKDYKNFVGSVLMVLAVMSVFVWVALAQDDLEGSMCCGGAGAVSNATAACASSGACPVSGACPTAGVCSLKGQSVAGLAVYLDSPAALLAKAELLALTAEQQDAIQAIQVSARVQSLGVLTQDQLVVLGDIPAEPLVLGVTKMKTCEAGCTKPCCADQAGGCGEGCITPCGIQAQGVVSEQSLCPVMNAPINKALFVEYQGKKVYFCCPGCESAFKKNPEQYLSKLPQFKL